MHTRVSTMWRRRRRKKGGPVGTEAIALKNIKTNSRSFNYPPEGFVTHIEHSLLYAMVSEPKTYPDSIVEHQILEEDFASYIVVASETFPKVSYAQLSAILALSAVKWPVQEDQGQDQQPSVGQKLCKILLKVVVRYAEENDLDRQSEVEELLIPVRQYATKRENDGALAGLVPLYLGYAATLITANPVPMLIGASMTVTMSDNSVVTEKENVDLFASQTHRVADVEKTSLLDELDEFDQTEM